MNAVSLLKLCISLYPWEQLYFIWFSLPLSLSLFALSLTLYFSFRIISAINRIKLKLMGYVFRLFHHQHLQAFILIDESFHCLVRVPCLLHTSMRCCRLTVLCEWNKLQYSCRLQFRIALTLMIWPPHRFSCNELKLELKLYVSNKFMYQYKKKKKKRVHESLGLDWLLCSQMARCTHKSALAFLMVAVPGHLVERHFMSIKCMRWYKGSYGINGEMNMDIILWCYYRCSHCDILMLVACSACTQ